MAGQLQSIDALAACASGSASGLCAGGSFATAGGTPSTRIAAWRCDPSFLFGDGFEAGNATAWSMTVP